MILSKRIKRSFFENGLRNISILLLTAFSMMLVVSLCSSTDAITASMEKMWRDCNLEDGSFETYVPLSAKDLDEISEINVFVEQSFYADVDIKGGVLRIFENRGYIDIPYVEFGRIPQNRGEILVEKKYAENHNISVGDNFFVGKKGFVVCGIGCIPDYGYVKQNSSDVAPNDEFGIVFVTKNDFNSLVSGNKLIYHYKFLLGEGVGAGELKEKLRHLKFNYNFVKDTYIKAQIEKSIGYDLVNISSFEEAKYNIRINDPVEDSQISKKSALISGIILLLLLSYMLAVFASGTVEQERTVIGTLYALGYSKKEILRHYMGIPMLVSVFGSFLGMLLGFALTKEMASSSLALYSVPEIHRVLHPYLVGYAIFMPMGLSYVINRSILSKKLNMSPVQMMRRVPPKNTRKGPELKNAGFCLKFRIRQFLREIKGNIAMFVGIMISLLLIMFSFACYGSIKGYIDGITDDINYRYMYVLRNPVEDLPKNSDVAFVKGFYADFPMTESEMEVMLVGIDRDNPFFDFAYYMSDKQDAVYMSSSARIKFGYKPGDKIVLKDNSQDRYYAFEIAGEVKYGSGLYFFMNIDAMREAFGLPYFDKEDLKKGERRPKSDRFYYNAVFSDKKIKFKHNMMLSETAKNDMKRGADKFMTLMFDMIVMLICVSVLLFVITMYLLLKLEIDRSRTSISLLKALGYSRETVHSLYIDNSFYITLLSMICGIPACKKIVDIIYPFAVSNVNAGFEASISHGQYAVIILIVLLSYFLTRRMLIGYLDKIKLNEILKDRE